MSIDLGMALAGLLVGAVVGLTGMGGGALLTPLLVLVFKVPTLAAVSSDLVVSLIIKPVGAAVHHKQRTIRTDILRWLALGSIPFAFLGSWLIHVFGGSHVDERLKTVIGVTLLLAAIGMIVRARLRRHGVAPGPSPVRPAVTLAIGVFGGLMVGLTSVGSGSLMIVLLMLAYPRLGTAELVGTDLAQAIPLVASATLGHVLFGDVRLAVVGSLLVGALPGVWVGSQISSRENSRVIRPLLVTVLAGTGLKLVGAF